MRIVFSNGFPQNEVQTHKKEIQRTIEDIHKIRCKISSRLAHAMENKRFTLKLTAAAVLLPVSYYLPGFVASLWQRLKGIKNVPFFQNTSKLSHSAWKINTLFGAVGTVFVFGVAYEKMLFKPYIGHVKNWKKHHEEILRKFSAIPEEYVKDPLLSRHICPLTTAPVRFPCRTPFGDVYECEAILSWLENGNKTDPKTQKTLKIDDLYFDGDLYVEIKNRMLILQKSAIDHLLYSIPL